MLNKGLESLAEGENAAHSDRRWHYRMRVISLPADKGLVQSMSRKGNCLIMR